MRYLLRKPDAMPHCARSLHRKKGALLRLVLSTIIAPLPPQSPPRCSWAVRPPLTKRARKLLCPASLRAAKRARQSLCLARRTPSQRPACQQAYPSRAVELATGLRPPFRTRPIFLAIRCRLRLIGLAVGIMMKGQNQPHVLTLRLVLLCIDASHDQERLGMQA